MFETYMNFAARTILVSSVVFYRGNAKVSLPLLALFVQLD